MTCSESDSMQPSLPLAGSGGDAATRAGRYDSVTVNGVFLGPTGLLCEQEHTGGRWRSDEKLMRSRAGACQISPGSLSIAS